MVLLGSMYIFIYIYGIKVEWLLEVLYRLFLDIRIWYFIFFNLCIFIFLYIFYYRYILIIKKELLFKDLILKFF